MVCAVCYKYWPIHVKLCKFKKEENSPTPFCIFQVIGDIVKGNGFENAVCETGWIISESLQDKSRLLKNLWNLFSILPTKISHKINEIVSSNVS